MLQSIHDCKSFCWASSWVPAVLVLGGDQPFIRRLIGVSTSPQVGSIYNTGVWDKAAAAWLRVDVRRTLDNEAAARHQYRVTGPSLENGGALNFKRYVCMCVCLCLKFKRLRLKVLVSFLKFRSPLQKIKINVKIKRKNSKVSPKNFSFSPGPRPLPALLQIKDVAVCGDDVHIVRVMWSDKDGERSVGSGGLHKLLAHYPALGMAVLHVLKEWKHGRQCAELWGPSRPYKPTSWAHLGEVGCLGCEDGALWRGMGGGEGKEVKEEREGASTATTPTTPPSKPKPPPKKKTRAKPAPQSGSGGSRTRTPGPTTPPLPLRRPPTKPPPQQEPPPPPKVKGRPRPKGEGPGEEGGGGWERSGGGQEGGRGGGTPDPLVGTPAHVPYRGGVEVGAITGVHTRKSGVVWVRYPENPKLYEVERHLIFGTAEAAEAHLQKVRKGKTPKTNPPPPQQSRLPPD